MFTKSNLFGRDAGGQHRNVNPPAGQPAGGTGKPAVATDANASRPTVSSVRTTSDSQKKPDAMNTSSSAANTALPEDTQRMAGDDAIGARLIVGPEVKLRGAEILNCDMLVVEGRVEATMDSRVLRITEHGSFSGKVSIDVAEIHGSFEGELTARSQLIIHSTGRVHGKICYGKLVAEEGCELCGDINILSGNTTGNTTSTTDTAAESSSANSSASGKDKSAKSGSLIMNAAG